MACSEARLAANRANALKSTGPKTDEGKERSRRNALKHGLTGSGAVIPGEDADEVGRLAGPLTLELVGREASPALRELAGRAATLMVRLRRSARHEFAATADRCRAAGAEFDAARVAEAERLYAAIDEDDHRDQLLALPEGVELLDAILAELRATADRAADDPSGWTRDDAADLARCVPPEARAHAEALGRALVNGDVSGIDAGLVAVMSREHICGRWALDQVVGLVAAGREHLDALRPGLDYAAVARARVEAINLALVDDAPAVATARRYEAATERSLYRALREIRAIQESRRPEPAPADGPASPFPTPAELVRQADAMRRHVARVEPAPVAAHVPALGSLFPAPAPTPAAALASKPADPDPAPRRRSRYEDRSKRPKLGR